MAKSTKKRIIREDKLDDDVVVPKEKSIEPEEVKEITEIKIELDHDDIPKGKATAPPGLDDSPFLNAGRIELAHASGEPTLLENEAQDTPPNPTSDPTPDTANANNTPPTPQQEEPTYSYDDSTTPEQVFEPNTGGPSSFSSSGPTDTLNLPEESAREGSAHLSNFIMDAYERFVPEGMHYWTKANEKQVKKLEESGDLLNGAYQTVKDYNNSNKKLLEERAKSDVKYLKKHVTKVLQVRQISASPEALLAFAVVIVIVGQAVLFMKIKKESDDMMDTLLAKVNSNRNGANISKDEIITPTVEVV